jgi:glycosyltransferase involved in cell wall biosynthesis
MLAIDVVIPAREEEQVLGACLDSLLAQAGDVDLKVIVVPNGPKTAGTAAVAQAFESAFATRGSSLSVIVEPLPGKARALNAGDGLTRGGSVVYLDADVTLLPGSLLQVAEALVRAEARLVSPPMRVRRSTDWRTRAFARVWTSLPAVAGDVIGSGCYAVNAAGRQRWASFPNIAADDAYVRSRFARSERSLTPGGGFEMTLPDAPGLVQTVRRWRTGNAELQRVEGQESDPRAGWRANLAHALSNPGLWLDLPVFALVKFFARGGDPVKDGAWTPHREAKAP